MMPSTELLNVRDTQLCVETAGDRADPAIVLISGATATMDLWPDEFRDALADAHRFVIRYDHRDTGRSATDPPGAPTYTGADLVEDVIGVLDALEIPTAHLVGVSMGSGIAQEAALRHPDRVASLTLIATSPGVPRGPDAPALPSSAERIRAHFADPPPPPDWSDPKAVVESLVAGERLFAGSVGFDERATRALAERVVERSRDVAASGNHWQLEDDAPSQGGLDDITAPALVIQGTEDPLFPIEHGEALARELPDARLVRLPGVGHQVPPPSTWDVVVPEILTHTGDWETASHRLAAEALANNDATGWFDRLYAAGAHGSVDMPWNRTTAHPLLASWTAERDSYDGRALVVGCGLGADAEHLAGLGFDTTAFDISETAVRTTRERYPNSSVHYRTADLLDPPAEWNQAYDLVVEIFTVQALPEPTRSRAITAISDFVAPGGRLFVVAFADIGSGGDGDLPPWPLRRDEIEAFENERLTAVAIDSVPHPRDSAVALWQAEFTRR